MEESVTIFYALVNIMVVPVGVFQCSEYGFSIMGVGIILRRGCGMYGHIFLELLQEIELAAECHYWNWT